MIKINFSKILVQNLVDFFQNQEKCPKNLDFYNFYSKTKLPPPPPFPNTYTLENPNDIMKYSSMESLIKYD